MVMRENLIRRKLEEGKTLMGMGVFTGSPVIIEMIGYSGFDFIFLETEHTAVPIATELRNLITAANSAGLGVICRVKYNDEVMIRQAFEFGADAVVVPHCRTAEDVRKMIRAAKFPPLGVRGAASDVRAAHYGCDADFNYQEFLKKTNEDTLCIALAEDPEFFDNMEEILSVPGLSAVSLGPSDLSLALGNPDTYNLDMPEVKVRFEKLYQAARERNIPIMGPIAPPTYERLKQMKEQGLRLAILRNDITNFRNTLKGIVDHVVTPVRLEEEGTE